jgi:hypothetical protein
MADCQDTGRKDSSKEIVIKFTPGVSEASIDSLCSIIGLEKIKEIRRNRTVVFRITSGMTAEEVIEKYQHHPGIEYIERNYNIKLNTKSEKL